MRPAALGLLLLVCTVAAPAAERAGAFFPSLARVHIPRGTAQLLKPYLPKPQGRTGDYRFVVELPRFASFVAFEPGLGAAPDAVTHGPGRTRVGVAYTRHVFRYRLYPTTGFELSICWQDSDEKTLRYQPAIQAGGTFDWTRLTATVAAPEGAAFARPLLIKWQKRGITGTIWADNVAFRPEGSERNLVAAGTFDEPAWKTGPFAQEGKGGGRCAKFVCTPERVDRQQALWVHPERKGIAVTAGASYVVELDLKVDRLGPAVEQPILAALFRASDDAPEGRVPIFTYCLGPHGKPAGERETELVVLPPLKNVRPKAVRIAPCHYRAMFTHPKVAQAYAENAWRSGITWSYGSVRNHVVPLLRPLGHRVWLAKPGHPFVARGAAGRVLEQRPELRAVGFDGKPRRGHFCPTWLLSPEGAEARHLMEEALLELVAREGYTAVNWDIEQPVVVEPEGGGPTLGFCLCPRCLEAFRKRQGLAKDEKLDPQAIVGKHRQAWAMFRCGQNAELVGHVRRALKRSGRPIEFSVYSGYQCQRTRERYGVDWALLAPHLDLAIAGYNGSRASILATRQALGRVPFIGGENYYLSPRPRPAATGWQRRSLDRRPRPEPWRNRLLRQFVDGGCNGVLIWYLPTMDGGTFYGTSQAAEIIAAYETLFRGGSRCDERFAVAGLKPDHWAAFEHKGRRLLLLLNFAGEAVTATVEQPGLEGRWTLRQHGRDAPLELDPAKFETAIEPWGTRVLLFSRR